MTTPAGDALYLAFISAAYDPDAWAWWSRVANRWPDSDLFV